MYSSLWLNYEKLNISDENEKRVADILKNVCFVSCDENNRIFKSIKNEIKTAFDILFDRETTFVTGEEASKALLIKKVTNEKLGKEGYRIYSTENAFFVEANDYNGLLYGTFRFIELIRSGKLTEEVNIIKIPDNPLRMLNHWDNMTGDIERGYSGNSFFFEDNKMIIDDRTIMYARAVSSVGINAVVINNVNVKGEASYLISDRHYENMKKLSEIFADYGIR